MNTEDIPLGLATLDDILNHLQRRQCEVHYLFAVKGKGILLPKDISIKWLKKLTITLARIVDDRLS